MNLPRSFMEQLNISYSIDGVYDILLCHRDGRKIATLRKQQINFGSRGWNISLPRTEENLALTRIKGTFLRDDEDDDEVYGYYTPETSELLAIHRDGSMELSICGGNLRAFLTRPRYESFNYASLTQKNII